MLCLRLVSDHNLLPICDQRVFQGIVLMTLGPQTCVLFSEVHIPKDFSTFVGAQKLVKRVVLRAGMSHCLALVLVGNMDFITLTNV